jgi:hypothetical protein
MDLQNINVDFGTSGVFSLFESVEYSIPVITNMAALKTALDNEVGYTSATLVVQYTVDQYGQGAVPRIVVSDGAIDNEQRSIIALTDIDQALTDEIAITRTEVEAEIVAQTA